jgi:hypothetical protein
MSLTDSRYIPQIGYVVAIHGSKYWYSNNAGIPVTQFADFNTDGGALLAGVMNLPQVQQSIDPMGGIATLNSLTIDLVEDPHNRWLSQFFRPGPMGCDVRYMTETCKRADTSITVDDNTSISADDIITLPRETMKVTSTGADGLVNVTRSLWSAFTEGDWKTRYTVISELGQGAGAVVGDGHYNHNGRWVCVYRLYTDPTGSWSTPVRVWAGVIETMAQEGGLWSLRCKSILELLDREIGATVWQTNVKEGWWLDGLADTSYFVFGKEQGSLSNDGVANINGDDTGKSIEEIANLLRESADGWGFYPDVTYNEAFASAITPAAMSMPPSQLRHPLHCTEEARQKTDYTLAFTAEDCSPYRTYVAANGTFQVEKMGQVPTLEDNDVWWWKFYLPEDDQVRYAQFSYDATNDEWESTDGWWYNGDFDLMKPLWSGAWADALKADLVWVDRGSEMFELMLNMLVSTGETVNGTYDTLPYSVALGIPSYLINVQAIIDVNETHPCGS